MRVCATCVLKNTHNANESKAPVNAYRDMCVGALQLHFVRVYTLCVLCVSCVCHVLRVSNGLGLLKGSVCVFVGLCVCVCVDVFVCVCGVV